MKKMVTFLIVLCLFPTSVWAYSSRIILGGQTIGINMEATGVMIIGFYKVNGRYPSSDLLEGDIITKIGNTSIETIEDLTQAIEKSMQNNTVVLTYKRGNQEKTTNLSLVEQDGIYKTGLYVKDSITGIGTLTFIDPETNTYGALGHEIIESNTSKIVEVKTGTIFKNSITSIDKSLSGNPGSKNAKFYYNTTYGDIRKNTKYGIYGNYSAFYDKEATVEVGNKDDIHIGNAKIYTVLEGEKIEEFTIDIKKINENSNIKNLYFEITDEKLLNKTGGIVQGMSGSPIIQDNKIIGAVTHVITDNVTTGYGIFITTMLEESER